MKFEWFLDESYFGLYAVRPEGDKDFNSELLFHVVTKDDAERLSHYLNSQKGELVND